MLVFIILDGIDVIQDNRSFGNTITALTGGIDYDYTRGIYVSSNGVWTTTYVLTVPNGAGGLIEFDIDGQNTNSGHNSANNKGVTIRQVRAFDVSSAGVVTLSTIGTDVSSGSGAGFVATQYVAGTNTITIQVQTTDVTQVALY